MHIDCDDYVIIAETNEHPAERHIIERDVAVGLSDARKSKTRLAKKYPIAKVRTFLRTDTGGLLIAD